MPSSHDLSGLMKFLGRDPWRECFAEVFDEHLGPVLDAGGLEFDDLEALIGNDLAMTLWGCAFEDFLTREFEVEGGNIVDEYLRRRGWTESAGSKAYIKALRTSVMSLYEVSDVVPGKSLMARDLIRGGEPVLVSEGTATKSLKQWDKIAARIVPVLSKAVFAGGLLAFSTEMQDLLFDGLRRLHGRKNAKSLPQLTADTLRASAFMFTLVWVTETVGRIASDGGPSLQNFEGEEILFHDVRFPLANGIAQKDVVARLNTLPGLSQETAKFWNWLEIETSSSGNKTKKPGGLSLDTSMDGSGKRVLGNVELKGRFLHLSVNSAARADKGRALLAEALADLLRAPLTEIRTVEQMMADRTDRPPEDPGLDMPPEIAEQIIHQLLDKQYRETLDQPVGMLGEKTPREAVRTSKGKQQVVDWLKYLENQTARHPDPSDPMTTYSFQWMWKELGVEAMRK
ncbi:MAG: hypothetical protein ACTHLA_13520 [Asticcacaulis sp.]|uniref:hypothetical protein n=1 Tax=Asticcacaulis sp. TaxID=1872648 RepID=UPI003F7C662D